MKGKLEFEAAPFPFPALFLWISGTSIHWACGLCDVMLAYAVMWKLDYRIRIGVPVQAPLLDSGHTVDLQLWINFLVAAI